MPGRTAPLVVVTVVTNHPEARATLPITLR